MKLIVGLGNPGEEYTQTRHNVGFMVIGHWAKSLGVRLGGRRFYSSNIQTQYQSEDIILLCPRTYMNRSGKAVKACVDFHGIVPEDILIVHDDIDLGIGKKEPAYLFRDGQVFKIYWSTVSREWEKETGFLRPIHFVDANNNPIPLKHGHTWLYLVTPNSYLEDLGSGQWRIHFIQPYDPPDTPEP